MVQMLCEDSYGKVAQYLTFQDLQILKITCKTPILKKYIAAFHIWKLWYLKKKENWINRVIISCLRKHTFSNRLEINLSNDVLPCSLLKYDTVRSLKKFVHINDFNVCQKCNYNDVDSAIYYSIGVRMLYSTPYVDFLCNVCAKETASSLFDYYQKPIITTYYCDTWSDVY